MGAEHDFIQAMTQEKKAGLADATAGFVRSHSKEIGSALVGATLATVAQYVMNRPGKDGLSAQQKGYRSLTRSAEESLKDSETPSFSSELSHATNKGMSDISDVLAKHPVKGALLAAPGGAGVGLALLKALSLK